MSSSNSFMTGRGNGRRRSHIPASVIPSTKGAPALPVQAPRFQDPHFPFQPLPTPKDPPPYRYDLSKLLTATDIKRIQNAESLVFHAVGDTGDYRGQQQDFVADMLIQDFVDQPDSKKPAFFYHLGDVVYFAGDLDKYGDNFYQTYKDYSGFIVSIPGNHDCQPDDPQDGPVDPNKVPLDGWVQNFMSSNPGQLGSLKTGAGRTQMDLPNVYWTFTTPFATIIGLFSNVGETQGEIHPDQIEWFRGELTAANPELALIVAVHHPPFSGDIDHSGSSEVSEVLFDSFTATNRYPHLILSGHVHNYQRFTQVIRASNGNFQIPCVVAGAGGYSRLGKLQKIKGKYPSTPLQIIEDLSLEKYDQDNFGFLRIEVSESQIVGKYFSAPYTPSQLPKPGEVDTFTINVKNHTLS